MIQYESASKGGTAVHGGTRAEKQRVRLEAQAVSAGLTEAYRREASREITRQVLALPFWQQAGTIMAYWSLPTEPDTRELICAALREGKTLLLPRCLDRTRMAAFPVQNPDALQPGILGIPEPEPPESGTEIPEPDLILVPCVAAAAYGARMGHGAGYYDRFLAEHPGRTVCLCFRALLRADLPMEETDILMDLVISD